MNFFTTTMSSLRNITLYLLTFLGSPYLFSQSIWNADAGNGTTDWATSENWLGGLPAAGKTVTINACTICPVIATSGHQSALIQIKEGGKLTLNVGGNLTVQNYLNEGITLEGTLRNSGQLNISGGGTGIAVGDDGLLSNNAEGVIQIAGASLNFGMTSSGTIVNNGHLSLDNALLDGISQQDGIFINGKTGKLSITNTGLNALFLKSSFNNNGNVAIDNSSTGIYLIFGAFNNSAGSKVSIKGSISLKEGIYAGQAAFNNSGDLTIDSTLIKGIEVSDSATFNNKGQLILNVKSNIGIFNVGQSSFSNSTCAYIQSNAPIINYASFKNSGNIREESAESSMISTNEGNIFNLNGGNFNVSQGAKAFTGVSHIWSGCVNSAWENPANWAAHVVPAANGNALPAATIPDVSKVSGNSPLLMTESRLSQLDLQNNAALTIADKGTLTITAFLQTPGPLTLGKASSLTIQNGSKLNAFRINNNEGLISNTGTIKITGSSTLGGIVNNNGTINNSGIINNSRLTNNGNCLNLKEWYNSEFIVNNSSFSNNGILSASKGIALQNYGIFNNYTEGVISISNVEKGIQSDDTFINAGVINIHGTTDVGIIVYEGSFTNTKSATINISRNQAQSFFVFGALVNSGKINIFDTYNSSLVISGSGTNKNTGIITNTGVGNGTVVFGNLINEGKITIAQSNTRGLETGTTGSITNESTGTIDINETRTDGLAVFAYLVNKGKITILNAGTNGFVNTGTSANDNSGIFTIHNAGSQGFNNTGSFKNNGIFDVSNAAIQGLVNQNGALYNLSSGKIKIEGAGLNGLVNKSLVNNSGEIVVSTSGLNALLNDNSSIFNNQDCGQVTLAQRFKNDGTFNNEALLRLTSEDFPINSGTFLNTGIIEDTQNALDGINFTNNAIRVRPISGIVGNIIPNALQLGNNNTLQIGKTWYLNANLTNTAGTYQISQNTFTHQLNAGTYTLYYTVKNVITDCSTVMSVVLNLINSSSDLKKSITVPPTVSLSKNGDINLYPNPASSEIFLQLPADFSTDVTVQIVDLQGRQVYTQKIFADETTLLPIEVKKFNAGMYLLIVQKEGKYVTSKRFVVTQ